MGTVGHLLSMGAPMHRHEVDIEAPLSELRALLRAPDFAEVEVPQEGLGLIALGGGTGYVNELDSRRTRIRVLVEDDCAAVDRFVHRMRARGVGTTHHVLD